MLLSLALFSLVLVGTSSAYPTTLTKLHDRASSCSSTTASCPAPSNVNTCCVNSPGGFFVQTQFWDYSPSTGPSDSWTIHGLWPDHCDGSFDATCDSSRQYTNIGSILTNGGASDTLSYMKTYWKDENGDDESFWQHEWGKHGTCVSTLVPSCYTNYVAKQEAIAYFKRTVALFKTLPTYTWLTAAGITPSTTATYSLSQLQNVAKARTGFNAVWNCEGSNLNEIWYGYTVSGTLESGTFNPATPVGSGSTCPSTGIKWLPKSGGSTSGGGGGGGGSTPSSKVNLNVIKGGSTTGCLISSGKWMVGATCASFTTATSGSGFTLSSSKGACAVISGLFVCASGQTATVFTADSSSNLLYSSSSSFFASSTPSGSTQIDVGVKSASQAILLRFSSV